MGCVSPRELPATNENDDEIVDQNNDQLEPNPDNNIDAYDKRITAPTQSGTMTPNIKINANAYM